MTAKNPFGDEPVPRPVNPFGDHDPATRMDPLRRLEGAPARLRALRTQVGVDGMTGNGMRQLLDELAEDLQSVAQLLQELER